MLIVNAFSVNMLGTAEGRVNVSFTPLSRVDARRLASSEQLSSAVGHEDTARVFSDQLGRDIPAQRVNVNLGKGDHALLGQYKGPRLPEGATELPKDATITWFYIWVT